ncbi:MAG TPA: response regulator [Verrucomicrobiae bacterium]|jgi:two-component system chemotaxis response regulator CheY|nr:response regulator [Verrucomicrobiae bacterium]
MKMLVVDDAKAMRTLLTYLSQEMGFATTEAADGREALETLVQNDPREPFDVALVDWDMPRMNGLELVQAVRCNRDFANVKILMVTTQNSMERVALALEAGADDFLMKPVTQEMLAEKLQILGLLDAA